MTTYTLVRIAKPRMRPRAIHTGRPAWIAAAEDLVERVKVAWIVRRRRRDDLATFSEVSDATLRDIGTTRSEIESWSAEADGRVPRTRRHVATRRIDVHANLSFFLKL